MDLGPFRLETDHPAGQGRLAGGDRDAVDLHLDRPVGGARRLGRVPLALRLDRRPLGVLVERRFTDLLVPAREEQFPLIAV